MRKFTKFFIIMWIVLFGAFPALADRTFLSRYTQTLYDSDNGMGASDSLAVLQARDGYIWAASYSGLIRCDGSSFTRYNHASSRTFTARSATALCEDTNGTLWIGTNDNGLFERVNGGFRQIVNNVGEPFRSIRSLACSQDGTIYVGASGGVGKVTKEGIVRIETGSVDTAFVLKLACDDKSRLWGVSRGGEVFVIRNDALECLFRSDSFSGHQPLSVAKRADGNIVIGTTDGGVFTVQETNLQFDFQYHPTTGMETANSVYEDSAGRLWVCGDNGLGYFDRSYSFTRVEGALMNSSIETICEDYEHNFWVSSSRQGLLQIERDKFMDVNFAMHASTGVVNSACRYNGYLYIATDNGLMAVDKGWKSVATPLTKEMAGVRIRDLMVDSKGKLWISTYKKNGLAIVSQDGRISYITKADGLPDNKIRLTLELHNGDVVVGTNNGISVVRDGRVLRTYTQKDGVANTTILSLCEGDDNTIYCGSDGGGIYVIKDDMVRNLSTRDGLKSGIILRLYSDEQNKGIWISTGSTLSFYDFHTVRSVKFNAPVNSGIFDIKKSADGRLMLLADTGVHLIDTGDLLSGKDAVCTSYMRKDGLHSTVTANSWNWLDPDGTLYLCCANGVYAIDLNHVFINGEKPRVIINSAIVDGKIYENPSEITLPSDAKRLTLDVSVLSFVNPSYNSARYQLEGFDREPVFAYSKELRTISYTNLKGGSYTFRLLDVANCDGIKNTQSINLKIDKALSIAEQPAVIALSLFAAAAAIFFATRWYYHRHNLRLLKRQEELRVITEEAIKAIANTIDAKDPYTRGHSTRVANYAVQIAKKMGMKQGDIDNLYYTALLHDIGKIGVPDNILNKPDKLTDREYAIMKQHPTKGGEILKTISTIEEIRDGAEFHHEKYDGTGYNKGLKGTSIPLVARIICVADSVDAMGSTRPYRSCRTQDYIISELERCSGTQFDPQIAHIFIGLLKSGEMKLEGR